MWLLSVNCWDRSLKILLTEAGTAFPLWHSKRRWCFVRWSICLFFGMGAIGVGVEGHRHPLEPRVCDSEHWLKCELPTERKDQQGISIHVLLCVWGLFLRTLQLRFLFFLFRRLPAAHSSCPVMLKYNIFWQVKSSALLPCYFENVSKRGKLSTGHGGLGRAGIGVLLGSLLL